MDKLILVLQTWNGDIEQARELTRLICDIEPKKREDVEFALAVRFDTDITKAKEILEIAKTKFSKTLFIQGRRTGIGWPQACNDLWAEAMMRTSVAKRDEKIEATVALTFEPDCVPLRADWIDKLKDAWRAADSAGKDVCGHAHSNPGQIPDHINGNAMFRVGLLMKYPALNGANHLAGWDCFHGKLIMQIGVDTNMIFQIYQMRNVTRANLEVVRKRGEIPALFHGTKSMDGIQVIRDMMADGTLWTRGQRIAPSFAAPRLKAPTKDRERDISCFIRTYKNDIPWLDYCLRSLRLNGSGLREIVIAIPEADAEALGAIDTPRAHESSR